MTAKAEPIKVEGYENAHLPGTDFFKSPYSNFQQVDDCVAFAPLPGGAMALASTRDPNAAPLTFDEGEVRAFVQGVKDGAFDGLTA